MAAIPLRNAVLCLTCEIVQHGTRCMKCGDRHMTRLVDLLGGSIEQRHPAIQKAIDGMREYVKNGNEIL